MDLEAPSGGRYHLYIYQRTLYAPSDTPWRKVSLMYISTRVPCMDLQTPPGGTYRLYIYQRTLYGSTDTPWRKLPLISTGGPCIYSGGATMKSGKWTKEDSGRRSKQRSLLSPLKHYYLFMLVLIFVYQITSTYQLLVGKDSKTFNIDSGTNKSAIKSLDKLNIELSKNAALSRDSLHQRGPKSRDISCSTLFRGDEKEITKAQAYMALNEHRRISDSEYMYLTQNCSQFRNYRGYIQTPLSKEEADFPIAFSILTYTNTEQVERLLRAIYMPQNYYCIHVDAKAKASMRMAIGRITRCFPNVFVSSRPESIYWGHISTLTAEMTCLSDLFKYDWKYYINLSGQMFPLQTNANLVKILKLYNGANDIEGTFERNQHEHMLLRQVASWKLVEWCGCLMLTPHMKDPAPHNVTIYKGSYQVAASREFVQYVLYSKPARDLFNWLKDTLSPDEYLLPTLNHNKHLNAPGGYRGDPEKKVFTARASMWIRDADQINWSWEERPCRGKYVRGICILGVGDLQWTHARPELFVNKLFLEFEPLTLDCLEELIYNRTMMREVSKFIPNYYNNLDIVKHRELVNTDFMVTEH